MRYLTLLFLIGLLSECSEKKQEERLSNKIELKQTRTSKKEIRDSVKLAKGEDLFNNNCSGCHSTSTEIFVGPGLTKIEERLTKKMIYKWVWNSRKLISSGDTYAVMLYKEYRQVAMPPYENLKEDDIDAMLYYIKSKEE